MKKMLLGVDVSAVARLRVHGIYDTPDPVTLIQLAQTGGADFVTMHLTLDRCYIHDRDVRLARELNHATFNIAIAPHEELLALTLALAPQSVCLIPENSGVGLNIVEMCPIIEQFSRKLSDSDCNVGVFIEPDPAQIHCALECGIKRIILNTTEYAKESARDCFSSNEYFNKIVTAAQLAYDCNLQVGAMGGLDYHNIQDIAKLAPLSFVEIGHSIISRSIICGLSQAVSTMKAAISTARNNELSK